MKKTIFTLALFTVISTGAFSQAYSSALGVRVNHNYGGLTYKQFIGGNKALDFTLSANFGNGFGLTGLYEIHVPLKDIPALNWYYGAGAHIGLWSNNTVSQVSIGVDGVVGIEWVPEEVPFAFSVDYIPSFSIISGILSLIAL